MKSLLRLVALVAAAVSLLVLATPEADAAPKARASATWTCDDGITITGTQNILDVDLVVDGATVDAFDADGIKVRQVTLDPATYDGAITAAVVEAGNGKRGKIETLALEAPDCGPVEPEIVTLSVGTYDVAAGETFDVIVSLDPGSFEVATVGFELMFDSSLIRPVTNPFPFPDGPDSAPVCDRPAVGTPEPTCGPINPTDTVIVAVINDNGWAAPADITVISFEAVADVSGETPLELLDVIVQNPDVNVLPSGTINGSVNVNNFMEPT